MDDKEISFCFFCINLLIWFVLMEHCICSTFHFSLFYFKYALALAVVKFTYIWSWKRINKYKQLTVILSYFQKSIAGCAKSFWYCDESWCKLLKRAISFCLETIVLKHRQVAGQDLPEDKGGPSSFKYFSLYLLHMCLRDRNSSIHTELASTLWVILKGKSIHL